MSPPPTGAPTAGWSVSSAHGATKPYALLTESSDEAAPLILLGLAASAEGGYGAGDPALEHARLAALVAAGKARYVLIEGPYAQRGATARSTAARLVCPEIPQIIWAPRPSGYLLVDCAGRAASCAIPFAAARAFPGAPTRACTTSCDAGHERREDDLGESGQMASRRTRDRVRSRAAGHGQLARTASAQSTPTTRRRVVVDGAVCMRRSSVIGAGSLTRR